MELAVVIPTFNEAGNIEPLVQRLEHSLRGVQWEAIFVDDDSTDGTAQRIREVAMRHPSVRCLRRIGRRGLSSACIEGMLSSHARYFAVMDADLQHDESLLPKMLAALRAGECDLAIGSRYVEGGGVGEWGSSRRIISRVATSIGKRLLRVPVGDPMSGFFMLSRETLEGTVRRLSGVGFKLLIDLILSMPALPRIREFPYVFRPRLSGGSKLDLRTAWDYLMLLADKSIGQFVPVQLLSFAAVGSIGVLVHLAVLGCALNLLSLPFPVAQSAAVAIAMVSNFTLNNALTYRDKRLRGWRWFRGLAGFCAACAVGALANVGVASFMHGEQNGWLLSALAGILVGLVWNYAVTSVLVWSSGKPR